MTSDDLLVEIGCEELPPKALKKLSLAFEENIVAEIKHAGLGYKSTRVFATPRRLAVIIKDLETKQADKSIQRKGPAVAAAFDKNGEPSKAAIGFANSCGVEIDQLEQIKTAKGAWLSFTQQQKGLLTIQLIPDFVRSALDKLPIPKRMRWADSTVEFVRPVHWILLLFGKKTITTNIYSVDSNNHTFGHRFHHPQAVILKNITDYEATLEKKCHVIPSFDKRRQNILQQIEKIAGDKNACLDLDPALLDEVTSMVEWPIAILGDFDPEFLDIPAEASVCAMKHHQKFFCLNDKKGKLLPHFITVSNIDSTDPAQVKNGNERVIRPRLTDAMFFWNQDKKQPLFAKLETLKSVIFQKKLGSLYDKTMRIEKLAAYLGKKNNVNSETEIKRAAILCKCDLMTNMVAEFPELQGIMGKYYASHEGENPLVSEALDEYYQPRFSGDEISNNLVAQTIGLADRIDTMVGIFSIGQSPTGDKDPFALRRAALACVRIAIEKHYPFNVRETLEYAFSLYDSKLEAKQCQKVVSTLYDFILGRLNVYYRNNGFSADAIESIVCLPDLQNLTDLDKRLSALVAFQKLPESASLAEVNKRISNILKKNKENIKQKFNEKNLVEPSEIKLHNKLKEISNKVDSLLEKEDYEKAMLTLADLHQPVTDFFDHVMVMDENSKLRINRLSLLQNLRNQFLRIADISKLQH